MKKPVFSGPSGRRARLGKIHRDGVTLQNSGDETPQVGDMIEFSDAPGLMWPLLEVRGDEGRICQDGQDRWITISSEKRTLLPGGVKRGFLPLSYYAGKAAAKQHDTPAIVNTLTTEVGDARAERNDELVRRLKAGLPLSIADRREAERLRREFARHVKHPNVQPPTNDEYQQDIAEVSRRIKEGIRLEKPQGSSLHHLRYYLENSYDNKLLEETRKFLAFDFQSMVIEHDWAQAFTTDDEGEVPMPFDRVCFEFRVSGLRVLVLIAQGIDEVHGIMCTGINSRWYINADTFTFKNGKFASRSAEVIDPLGDDALVEKFLSLLGRQIRAVCIMLDAGVADAEREEPSAAINKKRAMNGKTLLKPYHVVRLGKRHRRTERSGDSVPTGRHNRLHVRRGHWRHYKDGGSGRDQYTDEGGHLRSKTWINWMLVGSPDLGFVDKEYRL